MKLLKLKTDWKDYVMIGLVLLAITILTVNYFNGGWFCITFENVDIEDSGERCFQTTAELKEYANEIIEKYNTSEYRNEYISDKRFINNFSIDTINITD